MANRYVCIHGHFYQPPRENAWLESIEIQDSAHPFHDWNERINYECYAPNTAARLLDPEGYISGISNNYSQISFNFGPTLLSWMETADPEAYQAIQQADADSIQRYGGHGNAMAQVYNHLIMPLANTRDKITQVRWGIADFKSRFGRHPEGMWLAETAVDTETLSILADHGIQFTVLAPRQAKAFRIPGTKEWSTFEYGVETRVPYWFTLPNGKKIAIFFYNGDVSQAVAFEGLLNDGKAFSRRLLGAFGTGTEAQLVHIATDGESYGHHHRFGEMALANCLQQIAQTPGVQLINYGQFLELYPPRYEVMIHENSSWSCVHGVERWRSNCGCNTGGNAGWTQAWRGPLRDALDLVRDTLLPWYESYAETLLHDPWEARNDFIDVILHRNDIVTEGFIHKHARRQLAPEERVQLLRLMELQRNALLMYTSCGWFFDEISGIETNQILQYALRAMNYAVQLGGPDVHEEFVTILSRAPSNVFANGAASYQKNVYPTQINLERVGMHYAVASLFAERPEQLSLFNYEAISQSFDRATAGNQRLTIGRTTMRSLITHSEKLFNFAALHLGQAIIVGHIAIEMDLKKFNDFREHALAAFKASKLAEVIALMEEYLDAKRYTVEHLFRDEKRKILTDLANQHMKRAAYDFREFYEEGYQSMSLLQSNQIPVPQSWKDIVQYVVNEDLEAFFKKEFLSLRDLRHLAEEVKKWNIRIVNENALRLAASERLHYEIRMLRTGRVPTEEVKNLNAIVRVLVELGIQPDIWKSQNTYFSQMEDLRLGLWKVKDKAWLQEYYLLGQWLKVRPAVNASVETMS